MKTKPTARKITLTAAIATALTACGGTGQDDGKGGSNANQTFAGKAIDGYVARAQVFLDTNNNGTRDAWEPQAFTDNDGYFSQNPETGVNYCSDKDSELYKRHCLVSNTAYSNVVVRIKGGYDQSTGEPFLGQMSRRVTNSDTSIDDVLVTPITSLLAEAKTPEESSALLEALALDKEDLDVDYFKAGETNQAVLRKAITIHKTVTLLSDRLNDTYDEMGKGFGVSDDATSSVYRALAEELTKALSDIPVNTGQTDYVEASLEKADFLRAVLVKSEKEIRDIYEERKLDLPGQALADQTNALNTTINRASNIPEVAKALLSSDSPSTAELTSAVKALESLVLKVSNDNDETDQSVNKAIDVLVKDDQVRDNLLAALEKPGTDLNALADSNFNFSSNTNFAQTFVNNAELPAFVNKTMTLSDEARKYNFTKNTSNSRITYQFEDSQIILYFQGNTEADSGSVTACVKYINDAKFDSDKEQGKRFTLGDSNTTGELISGTWTKLDARQLLIRASYLGSDYQWLIKPKGNNRYQFDFDGKLTIWQADQSEGAETLSELVVEDIPTTNAECKQKLPLRFDDITL